MPVPEEKRKEEEAEHVSPAGPAPSETEAQEAEAVVAAAEAKAAELSSQMKELEDRYLRLAAEFDNFRKRTARDFQVIVKAANERLILELLELRDNFERALSNSPGNAESFKQGIALIAGQFDAVLKKEGVEELRVDGKPFDPSTSEAIAHLESERPAGEVLQVLSKGYSMAGRLVRPARVTVSKGKAQTESRKEPNDVAD